MFRIYNDFVSSLILACIVTILVFISLPKSRDSSTPKSSTTLTKTFIMSLALCYVVLYFLNDNPSRNNVMDHMIQGEPDF
jgi:hypothetical protein